LLKSLVAGACLPALLLLAASPLQDGGAPKPRPKPSPTAAAEAGPSDGIVLPILSNTWWKLKVKAKGYTVDELTGEIEAATFKTTTYTRTASSRSRSTTRASSRARASSRWPEGSSTPRSTARRSTAR